MSTRTLRVPEKLEREIEKYMQMKNIITKHQAIITMMTVFLENELKKEEN